MQGEASTSTPSDDGGSIDPALANQDSQSNLASPVRIPSPATNGFNPYSIAGFAEKDPSMRVFMNEYTKLDQNAQLQHVQARIRQIEERQDNLALSRVTGGRLGNTRFELNPQPFSGLGTFAPSSSREHRSFPRPIDNMQINFANCLNDIDIPMSNTSHPRVPPIQRRRRVRSAAELAMMRNAARVPKLVKPPFPLHPRLRREVPDTTSTDSDNPGSRRHYVPAPQGMTRNDVLEMEESRSSLHRFIAEYNKEHHTQMRTATSKWRAERSGEPRWRKYRVFRRSKLARETKLVQRRLRPTELTHTVHETRGVLGADPYGEFRNQEVKSCSLCGGPCQGT